MKQNKSYKFRIYPNKNQRVLIHKTFGTCRFVYNHCLAYRKDLYSHTGKSISKFDLIKDFVEIKKIEEFSWLKEIDSTAIQQTIIDLDNAYQNFFKNIKQGKSTNLNFKSKKNPKNSYRMNCVNNNVRIENNKIKLPKLGLVKFKDDRTISPNEKIKSATISTNNCNEYFVSILVEFDFEPNLPNIVDEDKIFSADMSAKSFMVSSEMKFDNQKFYRKKQRVLAIRQRRLSKKKKDSKNREKAKLRVARLSRDITNQRNGHQTHLAHQLVKSYDALCFEDLNIEGMKQFSSELAKTVSLDFSWSSFLKSVKQQCFKHNKHFVKISRWSPSSKLCSCCGNIKEDLTLNDRIFFCDCGHIEDRDLNASKNIKKFGLDLLLQRGVNLLNKPTVIPTESYASGYMTEVTRSAEENNKFSLSLLN
jgi:putative transposase